MNTLTASLREAFGAHRGGRLGEADFASWARDQLGAYYADATRRYAFRDDVALEALSLVADAPDAPEPALELDAAQAVLRGETPFQASRLMLIDPVWVKDAPCAEAAAALLRLGARLENGDDYTKVTASLGGALADAAETLGGDDYVELVVLEAAAILEDLRLAVNGTVELLGKGRPRMDASLLAERLMVLAQVLRGERPLRVFVRARGGETQVVLSY